MPIIPNEPAAEYYANPAVSFSKLKAFIRSPLLYQKLYITREIAAREDTAAMALGRAAHALILEGREKYLAEFSVMEEAVDRRTKAGKALWEFAESQGKPIVSKKDDAELHKLAEAVYANPEAAKLLAKGDAELSIRIEDTGRPFAMQGRLDFYTTDGKLCDLKTIENIEDLPRDIEKRAYFRQLALYRGLLIDAGEKPQPGAWVIGVEKSAPNRCAVYHLTDEYLSLGEHLNECDLDALADCYRSGVWPSGVEGCKELGPSDWLVAKSLPTPEFDV
jgi:hypothetical protein